MVLVYVSLIMNNLRKLEDVPNTWRAEVEEKLEELKK